MTRGKRGGGVSFELVICRSRNTASLFADFYNKFTSLQEQLQRSSQADQLKTPLQVA